MSSLRKAIDLLNSYSSLAKAQSGGRETMPPEPQAQRAYNQSFARFPMGISGDPTPDTQEQGQDWHGTVPGVPDVPPDEEGSGVQDQSEQAFKEPQSLLSEDTKEKKKGPPEPVNLMAPSDQIQEQAAARQNQQPSAPPVAAKSFTEDAMKSLAAAPRFSSGPVVPPRERTFLLEQGFSPEDVDAGVVNMTPRMRALFNRNLLSAVQKSITRLSDKIESK